jgi:hypothetical protein
MRGRAWVLNSLACEIALSACVIERAEDHRLEVSAERATPRPKAEMMILVPTFLLE